MSFGGSGALTTSLMGLSGSELLLLIIGAVIVITIFRKLKLGTSLGFTMAGAVIGAVLGFFFGPSVPLIGQLPLGVVLSSGANLNGMEVLPRSAAEQSLTTW